MDFTISRRGLLQTAAAVSGTLAASHAFAGPFDRLKAKNHPGWVIGKLTGAQAVTEALLAEGVGCVFGIPGAQENELWDEFKARGLNYLLVTHEFNASCMADGFARATGCPGVVCIVPGPGVTNALTGLGEALLDSSPIVAIVGDVGGGSHGRAFQVHSLNQVDLLKPVCKCVYKIECVEQIAVTIRQAFRDAVAGEPGPVGVVIPYDLFIEAAEFRVPPPPEHAKAFDADAARNAIALLSNRKHRVGIYAGYGCMEAIEPLTAVAELLQAPVATSVSGKGVISECHPLAVGWGFGPQASVVAENTFSRDPLHPFNSGVDLLLAIGVKFSEVSTGYCNPRPKHVIHVDANPNNLGKVMPADICVASDASLFLNHVLSCAETLQRPADHQLVKRIAKKKSEQESVLTTVQPGRCGVDPLALVGAIRKHLPGDGLLFTDVTASEHLAAEYFRVEKARSYFNPVDNQSMGWSIPAAIGAQQAVGARAVATITGDGCFLMSALELSTAAREGLPVKVFVLDDHAFHYMQMLQLPAYKRTTATQIAAIDYCAFAKAMGVAYQEVLHAGHLDGVLRTAFSTGGPVLTRVQTDYGTRKIRWIEAVRDRYTKELTAAQKVRFMARIGSRSVVKAKIVND